VGRWCEVGWEVGNREDSVGRWCEVGMEGGWRMEGDGRGLGGSEVGKRKRGGKGNGRRMEGGSGRELSEYKDKEVVVVFGIQE